jgi:uncharacterized repeat protein (TIGR03803 family)
MSIRWFDTLVARRRFLRQRRASRRAQTNRLDVEPLEPRCLLSITTLASLMDAPSSGAFPPTGLVEDSSGDLFGTTTRGGAYGDGTLFEIQAGSAGVRLTHASSSRGE